MNNYSSFLTLNKQQKQAVFCDGYKLVKVIAGAGSGKTTVLVDRVIFIKDKLDVSFANIACIAYNTKAAKILQTQIKKKLNINDNTVLSNVATFHSFCLNNVLRSWFSSKNVVVIDDDVLNLRLVKKLDQDEEFIQFIKNNSFYYDRDLFKDNYSEIEKTFEEMLVNYYDYFYDNCHKKLNDLFISKNYFVKKWNNTDQILFALNFLYFKQKFHASIHEISVDYFDIILLSKLILERETKFCDILTKRFPYFLIDEFQDIDEIQYEIIKILLKTKNIVSLFVVGDPDQCIYEWRRANVNILVSEIDKNFHPKEIKTIILNQNYRSANNILNYANSLISYNFNRYKKDLFSLIEPGKVSFHHFLDQNEEFNFIADEIKKKLKESDILPKDIICLTRTNIAIKSIETIFLEKKVSYQIFRSNKFLDKKEIKTLIYCLLFIGKKSKLYFTKMLETKILPFKVGEKTILKIFNSNLEIEDLFWNIDNLKTIFQRQQINFLNKFYLTWQEYLKKSNLLETNLVLQKFFEELNFFDHLSSEQKINVNIFIEELIYAGVSKFSFENIANYIEEFFISGVDNQTDDDNKVNISTIHQAKGLEFKIVFLFNLYEFSDKPLEEERRVTFVALTRAKNELIVTWNDNPNYYSNFNRRLKNKFINEMRAWEITKG